MLTIPSGDYRIDALLGPTWWGKPIPIDLPADSGLIVTYGFPSIRPNDWLSGPNVFANGNYFPLNEEMKTATRAAFAAYESQAGIHFVELADGMSAQIRLGSTDVSSDASGSAGYPGDGLGGDVWINVSRSGPDLNRLLSHEIGHALGLKHPGAYNLGGGSLPPGPYLPAAEDTGDYTVMSYNGQTPYGSYVGGRAYDVLALQYLYGAPDSAVRYYLSPESALNMAVQLNAGPYVPQGTAQNDILLGKAYFTDRSGYFPAYTIWIDIARTQGYQQDARYAFTFDGESPRVLRRLQFLRRWSHEQIEPVFP